MTSSSGSAFAFNHSSVQISGRPVTGDCLDSNGLTGCRATSVNGVVFVDLLLNGSVVIDGGVGFCDPVPRTQCCQSGLDVADCQTIVCVLYSARLKIYLSLSSVVYSTVCYVIDDDELCRRC
jgi:hypothetical protein